MVAITCEAIFIVSFCDVVRTKIPFDASLYAPSWFVHPTTSVSAKRISASPSGNFVVTFVYGDDGRRSFCFFVCGEMYAKENASGRSESSLTQFCVTKLKRVTMAVPFSGRTVRLPPVGGNPGRILIVL